MINNYIDYNSFFYSVIFSNVIIAITIILVGIILARILSKLSYKALDELKIDSVIQKTTGFKLNFKKIVSKIIAFFIYFIAVIMALTQLGIATTVLNIIVASIILIVVIAIFFVMKEFFPNILAGIILHQKAFISAGNKIKIDEKEGKIINIGLLETTIESKKNMIYIPNSIMLKKEIIKLR